MENKDKALGTRAKAGPGDGALRSDREVPAGPVRPQPLPGTKTGRWLSLGGGQPVAAPLPEIPIYYEAEVRPSPIKDEDWVWLTRGWGPAVLLGNRLDAAKTLASLAELLR